MLAAADCGPDWWIGVCGISGDTPQRREVWVSARVAADVKAQKRRTLTKDPQNSMPHRVLKARVQVGPEAFQDTPAKSSRGLRAEACDGSLENLCRGSPSSRRE